MNERQNLRTVSAAKSDLEKVYSDLKYMPGAENILKAINEAINEAADLAIRLDDVIREKV